MLGSSHVVGPWWNLNETDQWVLNTVLCMGHRQTRWNWHQLVSTVYRNWTDWQFAPGHAAWFWLYDQRGPWKTPPCARRMLPGVRYLTQILVVYILKMKLVLCHKDRIPGVVPGRLKLCGICLCLFFSCCTQISTFIKALHDTGHKEWSLFHVKWIHEDYKMSF